LAQDNSDAPQNQERKNMLEQIILLAACHFIGDFPFQSEWFVNFKGKSWEVCLYHSLVYASVFAIFAHASLAFFLVLVLSHLIIDPLKARWGVVKTIWQDQLLHAGVILVCLLTGIIRSGA
jgi:hypothetical protein